MFCKFHEVSRKATAPAHAPYLRPVGNSPAITANFVKLAGHFNPQKIVGLVRTIPSVPETQNTNLDLHQSLTRKLYEERRSSCNMRTHRTFHTGKQGKHHFINDIKSFWAFEHFRFGLYKA